LWLYLYLVVDVWSRKVVAWDVAEAESADIAAELVQRACLNERYSRPRGFGANQPPQQPLTLHADNGSAMRAATLALESRLEELVVTRSFSRPRVSNDSHFSEALFRTVKYRPDYPNRPFASNEEACEWVRTFVDWYNHQHRHSGIKFVTTHQRHSGTATVITSSPGLMRLPSGSLWEVNAEIATRLAEEPEFTSRLWRTPRNSLQFPFHGSTLRSQGEPEIEGARNCCFHLVFRESGLGWWCLPARGCDRSRRRGGNQRGIVRSILSKA
jgi:hypothetical protein